MHTHDHQLYIKISLEKICKYVYTNANLAIRIPGNNKDKEQCNYFSKTLNQIVSILLIVELKI